ncbi:ATP-grasp domain-containing protein, partial [Thermus scotoductus]|uniref:ATP-grasp domain-containing protein n=1 Tax=Thermus scotoductus TaxID=37636 RepID=UPI0020A32BF1
GLVQEEKAWAWWQGRGQGNTWVFAAGKRLGEVLGMGGELHALKEVLQPCHWLLPRPRGRHQDKGDVFGKGEVREEGIVLEKKPYLLSVRGQGGEVVFYPLVENRHQGGILRLSLAPAPGVSEALQRKAEDYARRALMALDYTGVLALEFFQVGEELLFNEMAPRVHNSGHWTLEGAETSQFENHLRALLGLPLGSTAPRGYSAMVNLIGLRPDFGEVLRLKGAHLHWYGKAVRPGRKVGHITLRQDRWEGLEEALPRLVALAQVPVGP